ncbi:MAG: hypothetical protein ACOYLG_13210 [Chitinophagaceae bacterium]
MSELRKIKAKDPVDFKFSDGKIRSVHAVLAEKLVKMGKGEIVGGEAKAKAEKKAEVKK